MMMSSPSTRGFLPGLSLCPVPRDALSHARGRRALVLLGRFFPGPRQTRVLQAGQGSCNQVSFVLHATKVSAFGKFTPCPCQNISAAVATMIAQCCSAARARPAVSKLLYNHDCKSTLLQNIRRSQRARPERETESFVPQRSPATATHVGEARWTALSSLVPRTPVPPYLCMSVCRLDGSSTSPSDPQRAYVTRHGRLVNQQDKETSNQAPPDSFPQMFRKCPLLVAFPTVAGERGPLFDSGFCGTRRNCMATPARPTSLLCKQHRHGDVRALLDMLPRGGCDRLAYYGELGR